MLLNYIHSEYVPLVCFYQKFKMQVQMQVYVDRCPRQALLLYFHTNYIIYHLLYFYRKKEELPVQLCFTGKKGKLGKGS